MRAILTTAVIAAALSTAVAAPAVAAPATGATAANGSKAASVAALGPLGQDDGSFDLQSHRGGRGQWTEESVAAFAGSLSLGVSTLELDTRLTLDDRVVVWHDNVMTATKCADTAPAFAGDPAFPYVGDRVRTLTFAQVETLDCGFQQLPGFPEQDPVEGNRVAELGAVFQVVRDHDAKQVRFNIETKVEVAGPAGADEMGALTRAVVGEIQASGMADRTTLQSFDWASINLSRQIAPALPVAALSSGDVWLGVGQPGASVNLGGIDIDDYNGSLAQAAKALGYTAISPTYSSVTAQMITDAHSLGLPVVPWTVNEKTEFHRLMDMGVDGIITDYPTRLREVMAERGLKLPKPYAL